ncbi:MAG: phosphoribosylglycinamide formyltransferase [Actinomycetota bacterium]|jgi:phosphoribosylglycinamide formyltransferase-1|nr:phosphoribosylglycinamide formyltransferase [Actinomycetota bacterium]
MVKRIAVFASGYGSNLQAIIDYNKNNGLNGEIALVFSNNKNAYALSRANKNNIRSVILDPSDYGTREEFDKSIIELLEGERIDLVVLAGYMFLVSPEFVRKFKNRILNIHPALLPSFKGTHGIKDAYEYGVKVTGATVHFVDEGLDSGPIIVQKAVDISQDESMEDLEEKIHRVEHEIYPLAVKYFCEDRLKIEGRKVKILNKNNIK